MNCGICQTRLIIVNFKIMNFFFLILHYFHITSITILNTKLPHHYITTLVHFCVTTLLHRYSATLLHYITTLLLTLLHCRIATLLHYYVTNITLFTITSYALSIQQVCQITKLEKKNPTWLLSNSLHNPFMGV